MRPTANVRRHAGQEVESAKWPGQPQEFPHNAVSGRRCAPRYIQASLSNDHVPQAAALPSVATVEQALELLAGDRSMAVSCIEAAGERNLLDRRVAPPWGGPEVSLFQHLLHMVAHLAQHKGQLFYYLKLMGKDVDTRDLWGT